MVCLDSVCQCNATVSPDTRMHSACISACCTGSDFLTPRLTVRLQDRQSAFQSHHTEGRANIRYIAPLVTPCKQARKKIACHLVICKEHWCKQYAPMVYLLNHQDDLIIFVITSRCFGYRQCVEDAARHCEPFVNPHKQAHKIACHLSGHISNVSMQFHSPTF